MTTITYNLSVNDLIAFHLYHYHTHTPQPENRVTRIIKSILPFVIVLPFLYYAYQSDVLLTLSVGGPLLAIFVFGIWSYLRHPKNTEAAIKQSIVKTYNNAHNSKFANRNTLQITEHGIIADSGDTETTYKWRAITTIATTNEHAFLYFSGAEAIIIPRSAFADDQAFQAFIQFAQAHIATTQA